MLGVHLFTIRLSRVLHIFYIYARAHICCKMVVWDHRLSTCRYLAVGEEVGKGKDVRGYNNSPDPTMHHELIKIWLMVVHGGPMEQGYGAVWT